MEKFVVTPEMVKNADTYIPLATKLALAKTIANICMEKVRVGTDEESSQSMPPRVQENQLHKHRALLGVFLEYYLHIHWEGVEEDIRMPLDLYDGYMSAHPMNQLERMKQDTGLKNRIFDLLGDWRALKGMIDAEIFLLERHLNDPAMRVLEGMRLQSDPEEMMRMVEEIKKLSELRGKGNE